MTRVCAVGDPAQVPDPEYAAGLETLVSATVGFAIEAIGQAASPPVPLPLYPQARLAARNGVSIGTVARRYIAGGLALTEFIEQEAAPDLAPSLRQYVWELVAELVGEADKAYAHELERVAVSANHVASGSSRNSWRASPSTPARSPRFQLRFLAHRRDRDRQERRRGCRLARQSRRSPPHAGAPGRALGMGLARRLPQAGVDRAPAAGGQTPAGRRLYRIRRAPGGARGVAALSPTGSRCPAGRCPPGRPPRPPRRSGEAGFDVAGPRFRCLPAPALPGPA